MRLSWKKYSGLIKFFGPLLFFCFLFKLVNPVDTLEQLKGIRLEIALISILFFPLIIFIRTLRWWEICTRLGMDIRFARLFSVYYMSWFLGIIPPGGIGALSKIVYLKEAGLPVGKTVVSITIDKIFDIIGLMIFGVFGVLYFPRGLFNENIILAVCGTIIIILVLLMINGKRLWEKTTRFLQRQTQKKIRTIGVALDAGLSEFWSGFRPGFFLYVLILSVGAGIMRAAVLYILALSLNIHAPFGLIVGARSLIGIVNVFPVSISGVGTRDAVLLLTLPAAGVSHEAVLALGFLAFLWILCSKVSGIGYWMKNPLPFREIKRMGQIFFGKKA
jgi:glycosyltransferase 2 family protein